MGFKSPHSFGVLPFVNLLILLTVLSVTAERITNLLKLRNTKLRKRNSRLAESPDRDYAIGSP